MKSEKLQNAFGDIKDHFILEAHNETKQKKKVWMRIGSVAACICIVGVVILGASRMGMGSFRGKYAYENTAEAPAEMYDMVAEEEAVYDSGFMTADSFSEENGAMEPYEPEQKVVITADISMETMDFDTTMAKIKALALEHDGYIENSSVGNYNYANGNYTLRIPSDRYETFMNAAVQIGHVTWQSENKEDISQQYYDVAGRLETQKTKLARLQELLSQATSMSDIITIESEINEVEYLIDEYSGNIKRYDSQVDYATVYVNVSEVYKYSDDSAAPIGFWQRLAKNFESGWGKFVNALESVALFAAQAWVFIVVIVAAVVVVVIVTKKRRNKK